jgi:hypothetical protein
VDVVALAVDRHRHRHVLDGEFVDRLHAEILERDDPCLLDRARHEIGRAADRHEIGHLVSRDLADRSLSALRLADHREEAELEHHVGELVHPGSRGRARRADDLAHHRIDRADVVDRPSPEADRQLLAPVEHVLDALVRRIAAGQHRPVEQQPVAGLPARHFLGRKLVEVHPLGLRIGLPFNGGPLSEPWRLEIAWPRAVEREVRVARRRAVGDHRHRLARGMARPVEDLDVENGRKPAEPLGADAKRIDLVIDLDAQRLDVRCGPPRLELGHVDRLHQRKLGEPHAMLRRAADADPEHARRAPAGAHLRKHLEHPVDDVVGRVHHLELRLVLAPPALGRDIDRHRPARHHLDRQHARRVVPRVAPGERRIGEDRGAQLVLGQAVGAPDALIDGVLQGTRRLQPAILPPFHEHVDDAGVLADRPVPLGAHPAVGKDLRDRILRRRSLLGLVGRAEGADIVHRVVVGDELQRVGHAFDQVAFADRHHVAHRASPPSGRMSVP